MWPHWADYDKSLMLMGMRMVLAACMKFQSAAVTMGMSEFSMTFLQRWSCAGAI